MNKQKGDRREIVDLENMHVRDLIVYYLKTEKEDHMAHSDEIIDYVRSSQPEQVKKGLRTYSGLTSYISQLKNEGILSTEGLEDGYYSLGDVPPNVQYWKIAPGDNAWNWEACLQGGYIAIGWADLGDISVLSQEDFNKQRDKIITQHPDWTKTALNQVWKFAHIPKGSVIVANRGTTEVLGFGHVTGGYHFVHGERYGHRLPVEWYDTDVRNVNESGWRRAMVRLKRSKVDKIARIPQESNAWVFQANPLYYDLKSAIMSLDELIWQINQSQKQIHAGDTVYLWMSGSNAGILAAGTILTEPTEMPMAEKEQAFVKSTDKFEKLKTRVQIRVEHVLKTPLLRSELLKHPILKEMGVIKFPNATNFRLTSEEANELEKIVGNGGYGKQPILPIYTLDDFTEDTGFEPEVIAGWERILKRKKHIVFQGPPGTGKTYVAERLAKMMVSGTYGFVETVQFHPAYAYEDFVQGIRPKPVDGGLTYELEEGRFLEFCRRADEEANDVPCILIIDEINRAHLSRVFGELMYLLEYRDKAIPLAAGGEPFRIPENVYLIGTMNTADRSIALVDHALRRRFSFIRLNPDYNILKNQLEKHGHPVDSLISVLKEINMAIDDPNYELGISFFMTDSENLKEILPDIWEGEIEPYLEEFFYDNPKKVDPFRWIAPVENKLKDWIV